MRFQKFGNESGTRLRVDAGRPRRSARTITASIRGWAYTNLALRRVRMRAAPGRPASPPSHSGGRSARRRRVDKRQKERCVSPIKAHAQTRPPVRRGAARNGGERGGAGFAASNIKTLHSTRDRASMRTRSGVVGAEGWG
jgi:hypothetical protein